MLPFRPSRVDHNDLRIVHPQRLPHLVAEDEVAPIDIGPDEKDEIRLGHFVHGVRHGRPTDRRQHGAKGRPVCQPCPTVDRVRSKAGPHPLLEEVVFFVGPPGGRDASNGLGPMRILDLPESPGNQIEGFLPTGFDQGPGFLDQGGLKPIGMVDEIVPKPSEDTEAALIGPRLVLGGHLDHFLPGHAVQFQLATTAAEGTRRLNPSKLPRPALDGAEVFCKGAHRAQVKALAAGDAVLFSDRSHVGGKTSIRHLEHIGPGNFEAGLNAAEAHHTPVKPLPDQGGSVLDRGAVDLFFGKFVRGDAELIGPVLKLAFPSCVADGAVQRMIDEQKL